jgi:hypothetical protein
MTAPGAPHRIKCGPWPRIGAELAQPAALAHLVNHLSWLVQDGRETCAGQTRGGANTGRGHAHAHVQRLPCSEVLQRRSPTDGFTKSRIGRASVPGRGGTRIFSELSEWREVVKDGVSPDSCTADLVAFCSIQLPFTSWYPDTKPPQVVHLTEVTHFRYI